MMTKQEQQLLLYWSGELEPDEAREIEMLLEQDESARAYLEELDGLREDVSGLPVPSHSADLVGTAIDLHERPVERPRFRSLPWLAAAAVIVISLGIVILQNRTRTDRNVVKGAPEKTPVTSVNQVKKTTLSERLLTERPRFREPGTGLEVVRAERKRHARLRIKLETI